MAKKNRSSKAKRSLGTLPKGLPQRKKPRGANNNFAPSADINPFENARASSAKGSKFHVHNRPTPGSNPHAGPSTSLARSMARRKQSLRTALANDKKAGNFIDRRIGEGPGMTEEQRMLARVVRERARRSKKAARFALDDDADGTAGGGAGGAGGLLTHKGRAIDESYTGRHDADDIILSDDDDDRYGGQLDRVDTEMHFGGGAFDQSKRGRAAANPYGPSGGDEGQHSMADVYRSRKEELDDMIRRRKEEKAEKAKNREEQMETFESLDESFKELAGLLQFRDKEKEKQAKLEAKRAGTLSQEDQEMDAWDKEMKTYLFERRVKATDRTKTPEEIAKEEAERLHELETRRLARMNGDFEDDDLSDISDDEGGRGRKGRKLQKEKAKKDKKDKKAGSSKKKNKSSSAEKNPDELDSDDEDDTDELEVRFTADGLVYVDKDGKVVRKVDEDEESDDDESGSDDDDDSEDEEEEESESESEESDAGIGGSEDEASAGEESDESDEEDDDDGDDGAVFAVGTKVRGNYHADEQFDGKENWFEGTVTNVTTDSKGNARYDITYNDGDFEEGMKPENVRRLRKTKEEKDEDREKAKTKKKLSAKKIKAKKKARSEMPYVFEVPTTLEALHDMIGNFASTGSDVSLIVQRIHAANSVRLDKNNKEKMQNFYDVLLRRFVEVGDAIYTSGDGGPELGRYDQLNALTQTLYAMAQDSPQCAGAVFGRRLGIMQKALAKRLRDAEFIAADDEDAPSAWPSTGTLLLLRALSHIFPVTDLRHVVVTPALIFLSQTVAQCPIRSLDDVVMGLFCSGLIVDYTKEAKRLSPEALAFISGAVRLFSNKAEAATGTTAVPSFELAVRNNSNLASLREAVGDFVESSKDIDASELQISLEKDKISSEAMPAAILCSTLKLVKMIGEIYGGSLNDAEAEVFDEVSRSILLLKPKSKSSPLPRFVANAVAEAAQSISSASSSATNRAPLLRRSGATAGQLAIKSYAPRMEDPTRYAMSKDKGKSQRQAILDRNRREYKREHKAATRELRLDAAFIENERRQAKQKRDNMAREKRNKNFAWLEEEQATMNQQVRMGGGLLKGGGIGAARAKARSGKLGIKKGGKF